MKTPTLTKSERAILSVFANEGGSRIYRYRDLRAAATLDLTVMGFRRVLFRMEKRALICREDGGGYSFSISFRGARAIGMLDNFDPKPVVATLTPAQRALFAAIQGPLEGSHDENSPAHRGFMYETSTVGRRGRLNTCLALWRKGLVQTDSQACRRSIMRAYERPSSSEGYVWLTPNGIAVYDHLRAA